MQREARLNGRAGIAAANPGEGFAGGHVEDLPPNRQGNSEKSARAGTDGPGPWVTP